MIQSLTKTMQDNNKVAAVLIVYVQLMDRLFGVRLKVKMPIAGTQHFWQNCIAFADSAEEFCTTVPALMFECLQSLPEKWCLKVFNRRYPPIAVLVSEKSRNRGLKGFPKKADAQPDQIITFYFNQLKGMKREIVEGLLLNGFIPEEDMKAVILSMLEKEWTNGSIK